MPLTRCSSASWSTSGPAVLARVLGPGTRGGGYGRWLGGAACVAIGSSGIVRLGGSILAICAPGRVLAGLAGGVGRCVRGRGLGGCVLGRRVLGRCILGRCVLGRCVLGRCVLGRCVLGRCVLGRCILGRCILGRCILGRCIL